MGGRDKEGKEWEPGGVVARFKSIYGRYSNTDLFGIHFFIQPVLTFVGSLCTCLIIVEVEAYYDAICLSERLGASKLGVQRCQRGQLNLLFPS